MSNLKQIPVRHGAWIFGRRPKFGGSGRIALALAGGVRPARK
jgi:hypothetical protein